MGQMDAHTAGQPWVYPVTLTTNSHNVIFNTENKFLDANIKAEISVKSGTITPQLASTNLGTYFNTGSASSNSISLTPQATTTAGFIQEFDTNSPKTGTPEYYTIITTAPSFTGGALTGKTASADFSSYVVANTTNNGIAFTAKGTAGRAAVTYTNTAGWLAEHSTAATASGAVSASTWNGTTYYIQKIIVPKAKAFTLETEKNTATDSSIVTITNNEYRNLNITNKGNITVTSGSNALGDLSVAAYSSSSDTTTPTAQVVVDNGVWSTHALNPTTSAQGPFYGKTTVSAVSQTNLSAANIKAGVTVTVKGGTGNIYNVAGTFTSDANATAGQILKDKTAYVNGEKVTGTMPNNGALGGTISTQNGTYTIPAGYTTGGTVTATFTTVSVSTPTWSKNSSTKIVTTGRSEWGTGYISANHLDAATFASSATSGTSYLDLSDGKKDSDTYIIPEIPSGGKLYINRGYIDNICIDLARLIPDSTQVANIAGPYILTGYSAYDNAGNLIVGTMTKKAAQTYTPGTSDQVIAAEQYLEGAQTILGDADLTAANIRKGANIFNVAGSYSTVTGGKTAVTAAALRTGYAGFANGGSQVNGTMPDITVSSSISASANMTGKYFTTDGATSSSFDVSLTPQYTNSAKGYLDVTAGTHNGTAQYYKIITATFTGNGGSVALVADTTSNSIYKSASNTGNISIETSAPATDSGYLYIKVSGSGTAKANKAGWVELDGATATGSGTRYVKILGYDGTFTLA